jgi:pyruvate-ferredoxin/flavodoxin oxidoreductase
MDEDNYFGLTRMTDTLMTDQEITELPRAWAVGGDGGMGDIGFQNVSKVVLQNRPNVGILMLDTQVYSNTGGQNSDSSPMAGGFDMNQFGRASQGKMVEKKGLAEIFTSGHGSPLVAQVSMANPPKLYRAILDGLAYRGTAFYQCFTTCQPEHGVGDDQSNFQARLARDSRGLPEFVFDPKQGETYAECFDLKGNPAVAKDWWEARHKASGLRYHYTIAHWAVTEARFRKHLKRAKEDQIGELLHLDDMLVRLTMNDIVYRRHLVEGHRAFVPNFGVYIEVPQDDGTIQYRTLSRQLVLYCVERRKAWRLLQSRAGVVNKDYVAQKALLAAVDSGEVALDDFFARSFELLKERQAAV